MLRTLSRYWTYQPEKHCWTWCSSVQMSSLAGLRLWCHLPRFYKAFYIVPHDILISRLESHGFEGWAVQWIWNWPDGQNQRSGVNKLMSRGRLVTTGVPKCSDVVQVLSIPLSVAQTVRLSATLANLQQRQTQSWAVQFTQQKEGVPARGTWTVWRSGHMRT